MKFGNRIKAYQSDILAGIKRMVAIPSVAAPALPGKPFG